MSFHHVVAVAVGLALSSFVSTSSYGQEQLQDKGADKLRLNKAEMSQYQALNALVDAVAAGKQVAPADVTLKFQNHFVKSAAKVFVPYVLEISEGAFTSFPVAMYVRAVKKPASPEEAKPAEHAFTDLHILSSSKSLVSSGSGKVEVTRALELSPGEFDLYIAMIETAPRNVKTPAKRVVLSHGLTVPDFAKGLTTSSIVLGKSLEEAQQPTTARAQMEQPYTLGGQRIAPTFAATFPKSSELLFLFLIYNEGAAAGDKPDLDITYSMFRGTETKPFGKLAPASFNAKTLPAEFSLSAGHQVLVAQGVPLATFAPGAYRLEIGVADKVTNQNITRTVPFSVEP